MGNSASCCCKPDKKAIIECNNNQINCYISCCKKAENFKEKIIRKFSRKKSINTSNFETS